MIMRMWSVRVEEARNIGYQTLHSTKVRMKA